MRSPTNQIFFFIGVIFGLLIANVTRLIADAAAAPGKPPASSTKPGRVKNAIGGGDVTLPCNLTLRAITINDDGSTSVTIDREIGGGHRLRQNFISADGASFSIDGVPVTSPTPAMVTLGGALAQLQSRMTAAYSAPGTAALLCAP